MTPEMRAFVAHKIAQWAIRAREPSLKEMALACCDRRTLAYQLSELHDANHQAVMLRSGIRLGFITPLGRIKPAGNA